MTFLPLSVQPARISLSPLSRGGGRKRKNSDLKSRIRLDMPDFPIKRKGFQSRRSWGVQKWKGLGRVPPLDWRMRPVPGSISQARRDFGMLRGFGMGSGAKTPSPPPPVGLMISQARPFPPPNLPGQALFLPSLPHYLLPLTSAPGPGAEGRRMEMSLGAVGIRTAGAPG